MTDHRDRFQQKRHDHRFPFLSSLSARHPHLQAVFLDKTKGDQESCTVNLSPPQPETHEAACVNAVLSTARQPEQGPSHWQLQLSSDVTVSRSPSPIAIEVVEFITALLSHRNGSCGGGVGKYDIIRSSKQSLWGVIIPDFFCPVSSSTGSS